jgi:hypothetical protein
MPAEVRSKPRPNGSNAVDVDSRPKAEAVWGADVASAVVVRGNPRPKESPAMADDVRGMPRLKESVASGADSLPNAMTA